MENSAFYGLIKPGKDTSLGSSNVQENTAGDSYLYQRVIAVKESREANDIQ